MEASSKLPLTKERIKHLLTGFNEAKGREDASALNSIVSLVEGYKRTEAGYFSASKVKVGKLLTGYKEVFRLTLKRYESLIKGFKNTEIRYTEDKKQLFDKLLFGYFATLKQFREKQRTTAEDINILDVLGFTYDEIRHTRFIAYLFNPLETHAQGNLFFKIFLKEVSLTEEYVENDYEVKTEETSDESKIDIEIISKKLGADGFIIHIENKVSAGVDRKQIEREYRDLEKKANAIRIPESRKHGFLLSVKEPEEKIPFQWIGWHQIAICLETFSKEAKAERAKWAAEQYLECIKKNIIKTKTKKIETKEMEGKNECAK